ncbi:MAG: RsmE family RNA methyltransferase [Tepidisphaeraceae bacterium]|jgi:16S rRNA (uracil1498-N3)-methyltransferase
MRRIHLTEISLGKTDLCQAHARYLRDVLRLTPGEPVEVFNGAGSLGRGSISAIEADRVTIEITRIDPPEPGATYLCIAAAVPKGPRADWMIEKLSELGVEDFFPLITHRGVVLPKGEEKFDRWRRLAAEASRQSGRASVMQIHPLVNLPELLARPSPPRWFLSPQEDAQRISQLALPPSLMMLIGPEGGWTDEEIAHFAAAGLIGVRLTRTILRIETAAIAAAAIAAAGHAALTARQAGTTI